MKMKMKMPTKSLKDSDNRIRLLNVLLGKSEGCPVSDLSGKEQNLFGSKT